MAKGHLSWYEQVGAMDANALAIRSAAVTLEDDVGRVVLDREEIPKAGRTAMARRRPPIPKDRIVGAMRPGPNRKDSSHPPSLRRKGRMAHRIDASMHTVQASRTHPTAHSLLAYP